MILLTDQNFKQEVEDYQGIVLVDFFASWCGPCQLMSPIIDSLASEYKNVAGFKIAKINIDENQAAAEKFNIMSIPTLYIFNHGKSVEQINGYRNKEELKTILTKHLPK